jgi:hypothetical protein
VAHSGAGRAAHRRWKDRRLRASPENRDGKPEIRGTWQLPLPPAYLQNLAKDLKAGEVEMTPWAHAIYDQRRAGIPPDAFQILMKDMRSLVEG